MSKRFSRGGGGAVGASALRERRAFLGLGAAGLASAKFAGGKEGNAGQDGGLTAEVWAEAFGAAPSKNGGDNREAFQAAIEALPPTGGTVRFSGSYRVSTLVFPNDPKVVNLIGGGPGSELTLADLKGPLVRKQDAFGRITGARIAGFTARAHPDHDVDDLEHIMFAVSGWCASEFDVGYRSDRLGPNRGGSVGVLFEQSSARFPTYGNRFRAVISQSYGPGRVVRCHNGGMGTLHNPNRIELRESWIYGCAGIRVVFDAGDSTGSAISSTLIEDCPDATAVVMGQSCVVEKNWFEKLAVNIATDERASTDGSSSIIIGNYFSGDGRIDLRAMGVRPLWIGNSGGGMVSTQQGLGPIESSSALPSPPKLTGPGRMTLVSETLALTSDATGRSTFQLRYAYAPKTAPSVEQLKIILPPGHLLESAWVGAQRDANGHFAGIGPGADYDGTTLACHFIGTDSHTMNARITLRRL